MPVLPTPPSPVDTDPVEAERWVAEHLGDLTLEGPDGVRHGGHHGGQTAADTALAGLDVSWYAKRRSTVLPESSRGATRVSPYVRHGLLPLRTVWDAVAGAPGRDRFRYREELMWQEYARHLYARVGRRTALPLRREQPVPAAAWSDEPWPREMACMDLVVGDLHDDGWLVNQTRMWAASQWAVRAGADWRDGEDELFRHLLDGSRAANRLGWQWTVGTGSAKPYGFSRWQVEKRSPQLCRRCSLRDACPVQQWPESTPGPAVSDGPDLGRAPTPSGPDSAPPVDADAVWLTAESLGADDPALAADPDRPAVFCFDEPLLARLRLSGKRLVFLAETLGELATTREVEVRRGAVADEVSRRRLAATYAPVPGFATRAGALDVTELHPWPWLVRPGEAPLRSFSAWRKAVGNPGRAPGPDPSRG